jgi:hypothetical protein
MITTTECLPGDTPLGTGIVSQTAVGREDSVPGAVLAIQTFGNLGDLNPHLRRFRE